MRFKYGDTLSVSQFNEIIDKIIGVLDLLKRVNVADYLYLTSLQIQLKSMKASKTQDLLDSNRINALIRVANFIAEYNELPDYIDKYIVPGDTLDPEVFNSILDILDKVKQKWEGRIISNGEQ